VSRSAAGAQVRALRDVSESFERGTLSLVWDPPAAGNHVIVFAGCCCRPMKGQFVDGVEVNGLSEAERTVVRQRKSVLFSKRSGFFTLFPRLTMSHLALNFVMQPCPAERKWQEICSVDSVWETSSIKKPNELSPGKSSGLPLQGLGRKSSHTF